MKAFGEEQNVLTPILLENSMRGIFGFMDVKLRSKEQTLVGDYRKTLRVLNAISIKTSVIAIIPAKLFEVTTILGLFVIFCYVVFISSQPESLLPLIALYAASAYRLIPSLSRILPAILNLEQFQYLFAIYNNVLSSKKSIEPNLVNQVILEKSIGLKNISFRFQNENKLLFENLSIDIPKGEVLGIIGRSGSGKTSLANIIAGFLIPESGQLTADGIEINTDNIASWMDKVSYVQQSPYLEKGSLTSNIAFLDDAVDSYRLKASIKKASLDGFVSAVSPDDVLIEEQGKNLSGGQRQRVIIARALYHDSKLIILDEATAALDNEIEDDINETVKNLRGQGITIIIIAHRLTTLKYTDRILRMENGRVIEETTYSQVNPN